MNPLPLLQQVVSHTPSFVWGILLLCIAMGAMQSRDRRMTRRRVLTVSAVWCLFGLWGVVSAFGLQLHSVAAWLVGLGLTVGALKDRRWPAGVRFDSGNGQYFVPGSWLPMGIIMTLFMAKYSVGVSLGLMPQLAHVALFGIAVSALYGALSGLFIARPATSSDPTGVVAVRPARRSLRDNDSMSDLVNPSPSSRAPRARALLKCLAYQLLLVVAISLIMALVLVLVTRQAWAPILVYSGCITLACSSFIQGGRLLALRLRSKRRLAEDSPERAKRWPGWPLMIVVLVLGTGAGYSVGIAAGNWLTGYRSTGLYESDLGRAATLMLFSLVPGFVLTFYALSRARLNAAKISAQTAQRVAAESRLRLLESQLEPHMLFNTLANLRVLIGMDPARAQQMLDQLIAFLRATLQASRSGAHPLSAEFARVGDYLALMAVRMGSRLQYQLTLPPDLATCLVPPLLLQPLVENAIKHGLESHVAGGRLEVSASRKAGQLLLLVRDTGAGLVAGAQDKASTQFGLQQVRERLHASYGDGADLRIESATDGRGGTLVSVRLPCSGAEAMP